MRKLLVAIFLLTLIVAAPLAILRSENATLAIAQWAVAFFTDFQLVLQQPVLRPLEGTFSASELQLQPQDGKGPPLLSVLDISGQVSVLDLLAGKQLSNSDLYAGSVIIYVSDQDETEDPAPLHWLGYLAWLPRTLQIDQLHAINASEEVLVFPFTAVQGERREADSFYLSARAQYEGEPLEFNGRIWGERQREKINTLKVEASFHAPVSDSRVQLEGELRGTEQAFDYDLALDAQYRDVAAFLDGLNAKLGLAGSLTLEAAMHGDAQGFILQDARLVLDNMPQYGIEAAGRLEYDRSGTSAIEMVVAGEIDTSDPMLAQLPLDLGPFGRAGGNAKVSGSLNAPRIDRFLLRSESDAGLIISLTGQLDLLGDARFNRVKADLQGPGLSVLSPWTGPLPYETGAFQASGVLSGSHGELKLRNLVIESGTRDTLQLRIEGEARSEGKLTEAGLAAIRDVQVHASLETPDSQNLSSLWHTQVPGGFAISANLQLRGSADELDIIGGDIQAQSSDIDVRIKPENGTIRQQQPPYLSAFTAPVSVSLSDTSALSQFFTTPIPVLGAVQGKGTITQYADRFALEAIELALNSDGPDLSVSGEIRDLTEFRGISLHSSFSGIEARDLLMTALEDFTYEGDLAYLDGGFHLSDQGSGRWQLNDLVLHTSERDGAFELSARGRIDQLFAGPAINLDAQYHLRDPDLLAALSRLRMNPVSGMLQVQSSRGTTRFESQNRIGETVVDVTGSAEHRDREIRQVTMRLESPLVLLDDLGLQAEQTDNASYNPTEVIHIKPVERLERALRNAPDYATDLSVALGTVRGVNTDIDGFDLHLTGNNKRYTLRKFNIAYGDTVAEVRGLIDLNSRPAFVSLAGNASAIPLNKVSGDLGKDTGVSGIAHIRGGVSATGATGEALLGDLDGNIAIALEDAEIEGAAYDILATDFLEWIYSGAALEKSTHVDCTLAGFSINDGVATSDSLYVETTKMVATGSAKINLGKQTLDIELTPRSKSRSIQIPSSVRLRGDFANPKVTLSPVKAAVDAYAQVLTLVPRIASKVFGISKEQKTLRPCITEGR